MTPPGQEWSAWEWSDQHNSYYRYCFGDDNQIVYDWASYQDVPRTEAANVEGLAEGVAGLRYNTDEGAQAEGHVGDQYEVSGEARSPIGPASSAMSLATKQTAKGVPGAPKGPRGGGGGGDKGHRSSAVSSSSSKHKAIADKGDRGDKGDKGDKRSSRPKPHEASGKKSSRAATEGHRDEAEQLPASSYSGPVPNDAGKGKGKATADAEGGDQCDPGLEAGAGPWAGANLVHVPEDEELSAEMMAAMTASRETYALSSMRGGYPGSGSSGSQSSHDHRTGDPDEQGHIIRSPGQGEPDDLDPRYRIEMSWRFGAGMVFKVLWPEPMGSGQPSYSSDRSRVPDGFGGDVHVGFRRFIIIANDAGCCTCVPILAYNNQACRKKGVKPDKHGIVYEKGKKPQLLKGEPPLGFKPVAVVLTAEGEVLSRESRVNYAKLTTIEHNVKVFFIGHVADEDFRPIQNAVDICWQTKNRSMAQKGR